MRVSRRRFAVAALAVAAALAAAAVLLDRIDRALPPPLDDPRLLSTEVVDRNGELLRVFANGEGRWRLKADLDRIDPQFVRMLIAYEDKRFYHHSGVDPLAMARAAGQWLANGRIVSGGSTITMQLARLIEPRTERSIAAKLRQMVRAVQIERRLTKREILERYLTLAPYGGNLEGVRAAALSWFGKEPARLAPHEAALLVALPQSPEWRRPDRQPGAARLARDRVMARMAAENIVDTAEAGRVARFAVPSRRLELPQLAAHLAAAAVDRDPFAGRLPTTVERALQARLEAVVRAAARRMAPRVSIALVVADAESGDILASIGSPDHLDETRSGWIDMTQAARSPGSTLKPFVYGLAIEDGLVLPETLISDRPADFDGYRPANFDLTYQGDVSVRRALQMSLNVPAVRLVEAVSPARLVARMRRAGVTPMLAQEQRPGLGLVLGGASLTLTDLVQLYANLVRQGPFAVAIGDGVRREPGPFGGPRPLSPVAAWHVIDMLSGVAEPVGAKKLPVAYKTGTSYGYRDAWAVGFDGGRVIGVWVGRADNGAVPGISGMVTAAPLLFEAFDTLAEGRRSALAPLPRAPAGAVRLAAADLPPALRVFDRPADGHFFSPVPATRRLHIAFPANGTELESPLADSGAPAPVVVKLQGGTPPFRLMANGVPVETPSRRRQMLWVPDGAGTTRLTVVDGVGQARSVEIVVR
ncbi:MAG: penicillin-binding protein 1C [Alphaproteobacteria bacterium]|nr:MAG: penicillin-binding protein 1C [Alphaproteobacteria bacterium]